MDLGVPYNTLPWQPFLLLGAAPDFSHLANTLARLVSSFPVRWVVRHGVVQKVLKELGGRGSSYGAFEEEWGLVLPIGVGIGKSCWFYGLVQGLANSCYLFL